MALPKFPVTGNLNEVPGLNTAGELVVVPVPASTQIVFSHNIKGPVVFEDEIYWIAPVTVTVTSDGTISDDDTDVLLLANSDTLNVTDIQWKASIQRQGYAALEFWFNAPANGVAVDLASVVRVPGVTAQQVIEGPAGPPGDPSTIDGGSPGSDGDTFDANSDPGEEYTRLQLRRGTTAQWAAATDPLLAGEPGFNFTTKRLKIGDGTSLYSALEYLATIGDVNELLAALGTGGGLTLTLNSDGFYEIGAGEDSVTLTLNADGFYEIG